MKTVFHHTFLMLLFCFSVSTECMQERNLFTLLKQRETFGRTDTKKIKNSIATMQHPEVVDTLRKIDIWEDVMPAIPIEYVPDESASFEDNILMDIIPPALHDKTHEFKTAIAEKLTSRLHIAPVDKLFAIALVEAGAHPDIFLKHNFYLNEYNYTNALLTRGGNPNIFIEEFNYGYDVHENQPLLFSAEKLTLIKLMILHGANIHARSSISRETILHAAANNQILSAEILLFYIRNNINVNAKDAFGSTPLEVLILNKESYVGGYKKRLPDVVNILLNNGAHYKRALKLVEEKLKEPFPILYTNKCRILYDILTKHDAYAEEAYRLRNITLD